jgi:hypothetical protein
LLKKNLHPALRSGSYFFSQSLAVQPGCSGAVGTKSHRRRMPTGRRKIKDQKTMNRAKSREPPTAERNKPQNRITTMNSIFYSKTLKIKIMETAVKEKTAVSNNNKGLNDKKEAFVNANKVNKDSVKEPEPGKEQVNGAQVDAPQQPGEPIKTDAPKTEVKNEPAKTEVKAEPGKPVLNLEGTLKLVEELHRRTIQRAKLLTTIESLEAFEIELREDADVTGTNAYQRCELTIEDDKGKTFSTKNPTIIWTVAQMVNRLCVDKLAEIEAGITIPA